MSHTIPHSLFRDAERPPSAYVFLVFLLSIAALVSPQAQAQELSAPIASRNLSPVYQHLGIPVMQDAVNLESGMWQGAVTVHWASHSLLETTEIATLEFDGETQRYDFTAHLGLAAGLQLQINIPYIEHQSGHLDSLIDRWHSFWGFPEGARPKQPQDRLLFSLTGPDNFLLDRRRSGFGDIEWGLAAELATVARGQLTGFVQVKLDTGNATDFTGSGDLGYSAGLRWSRTDCLSASIACHAQLGYAAVGDSAITADAEDDAFFASASLVWAPWDALAIVGQLDWHEVVYRNDPIRKPGAPLWGAISVRWYPTENWSIDAGFSEDLAVGASPDITWRFGVTKQF